MPANVASRMALLYCSLIRLISPVRDQDQPSQANHGHSDGGIQLGLPTHAETLKETNFTFVFLKPAWSSNRP
jgi:hypothetical protein